MIHGALQGVARGIVLLADDTRILDTTLHGMAAALGSLPGGVSVNLMFVFQSLLNFFLPSGSGQAHTGSVPSARAISAASLPPSCRLPAVRSAAWSRIPRP